MAKIWVLDTETKGTGANMVPLEDVRAKRTGEHEPVFVPPPRRQRAAEEPAPRRSPRFKVVDVMTAQTLAEGAIGRETLAVLNTMRTVVDVGVWFWDDETERWRVLTPAEQRALWDLRARIGS